jgi:ADP-dependent NAD(P)H-hydrate dehydratase
MTTDLHGYVHAHPLPAVGGDKEERGSAVIVAGAPSCPGAAVLSATAALRAGAGRVQVVTHPELTTAIGLAVPEAFVIGWDQAGPVPPEVADLLDTAAAVLVGPGLAGDAAEVAPRVAEAVPAGTPLLLDARALPAAASLPDRHLLLLPNLAEAEELAGLVGIDGGLDGEPDARRLAEALARALGAVVAVRGEETVVVGEGTWSTEGHRGLGTAGSGDVLVGVAIGLAARQLPDLQAVAWAVAAHAAAGALLGRARPNPGYLARELLDALPSAIDRLGAASCCRE